MNKAEILIVDDELQIRKLLEIILDNEGYNVIQAANGKECLRIATMHPPDLILLDIGLPDKNGQIILKELREWYSSPIIILSVMDDEENIVCALDSGATDYITKPFRNAELLARIRSALRNKVFENSNSRLKFDELEIDLASRIVRSNEDIIKLTATEYNLLLLFVQNEGRVLTHQYILKNIWGVGAQLRLEYLRVFVGTLRKKIELSDNKHKHIVTESGIGYRFQ